MSQRVSIMAGIPAPILSSGNRRWSGERRSAWLRLVALAILLANLDLASHQGSVLVQANVVVGYGIMTVVALVLAMIKRGPRWFAGLFVVLDALFVVVLFHEHLFAPSTSLNHDLTAPSLAIGFMLLTHVALRLRPRLVLLFSGVVVAGWLSLLFVAVEAHLGMASPETIDWSAFLTEGALAAAFAFSAAVCCLLVHDHNVQLARAVMTERRRANLSRFFAPAVLGELEATGASLSLGRRRAAVMFVDLRSFTRLSEVMALEEIAGLLAEFRELVTREVFAHGGMIDKFIGDGVMAAFSQPQTPSGDATRAIECAIHLGAALSRWKEARGRTGKAAPDAGIGLHVGMAISGVLHSGSHDEFTLLGDTVNVAERLERLTKTLDACIVVSEAAIVEAGGFSAGTWDWAHDVELDGRAGRLNVAYLPRRADPDPEQISPRGGRA